MQSKIRAYIDGDLSARILTDFSSSSSSTPSVSDLVDCEGKPWRRIRFSPTPFTHPTLGSTTKITVALEPPSGGPLLAFVDATGYTGVGFNWMTLATNPPSPALRADVYNSENLKPAQFGYRVSVIRTNDVTDPAADTRAFALFLAALKFRDRRGSDVCNQYLVAASIISGVTFAGFCILAVRWVREKMSLNEQQQQRSGRAGGHVLGGGGGVGVEMGDELSLGHGAPGDTPQAPPLPPVLPPLAIPGSSRRQRQQDQRQPQQQQRRHQMTEQKNQQQQARQGDYELGRMNEDDDADDD